MKTIKTHISLSLIFIILVGLSSCQSTWAMDVLAEGQTIGTITGKDVAFHIEKSTEEVESVPLGQLLYDHGLTLINQISLSDESGSLATYTWDEIAENTTVNAGGTITISDQTFQPTQITAVPSLLMEKADYSILDIAPTVAAALGWPSLPDSTGEVRLYSGKQWDQAVLILVDGLQFEKLQDMKAAGDLPFLVQLEMVRQGLTVYPPITTTATASLLTGAPPAKTGVYGYGYRDTDLTTLFDLATEQGQTVIAVEGASLPFNLRNAETTLSGDRDGDGFSDDNVFENALAVIQSEMPGLLYVHFHEVDDMGHSYGPVSAEYHDALVRVDTYLSDIYAALPENTFIAIFADHGMHTTEDGGGHGTLTANDLIIPIIFLEK